MTVSIVGSLLCLGTLLIVLFIILEILVKVLQRDYKVQAGTVPLLEIVRDFANRIYYLFTVVGVALLAAALLLVNHLTNYWKFYLGVGIFALASSVTTNYGSDAIQMLDKAYTQEGVKFNKDIIIPVADLVRVSYDSIICWANLVSGRFRMAISVCATIFVDCTEIIWHQIILDVLNIFTSTLTVLFDYIDDGLTGTLETHIITESITTLTLDLKPALDCMCYDLDFAFAIITTSLNDTNLHYGIQYLVQAALDLVTIVVEIVIAIFQLNNIFACPNAKYPNVTICYQNRPPQFTPVASDACIGFEFAGTWIDFVLQTTFDQFFENPGFFDIGPYALPKIGIILSRLCCICIECANNILDIAFHVDLIFEQNVLYFQYIDVDTPFFHGYEITTIGLPVFFAGFQTQYMIDIGCAIGGYSNASILVIEFVTKVAIKFASTKLNGEFITTILNYIAAYDLTPVETSINYGTTCMNNLANMIDEPLGQIFTYFFRSIGGIFTLIISMITNLGNNFGNFLANDVVPQADVIIENVQLTAIGLGNFFRQFNLGIYGTCNLLPTELDEVFKPYVNSNDPFCYLGGLVQGILVGILECIRIIIDSIQYLVTTSGNFQGLFNNVLILSKNIIPVFAESIESLAGLLTFFFGTGTCAGGGGSYESNFKDVFTTTLNFTLLPIYAANTVINGIKQTLDGDDITFISCNLFTGFYDLSIGNVANQMRSTTYVVGCLVGSFSSSLGYAIYEFGYYLWEAFGWGPGNILRPLICDIITTLIEIIEFIINFLQNPAVAIFNLLVPLLNTIIGGINLILCYIEVPLYDAYYGVTGVWNCLNAFFTTYIPWIVGCIELDKHGDCGKLSQYPCTVPDFTEGSCVYRIPNISMISARSMRRDLLNDTIIIFELFEREVSEYGHPCYQQYSLLEQSSDNVTRYLMQRDVSRCVFSAAAARLIDTVLRNNVSYAPSLVSPNTFYDSIGFINTTILVGSGVRSAISYESQYSQNETWQDYAKQQDIDPEGLKYAVGSWVVGLIDGFRDYTNGTTPNFVTFFYSVFSRLGNLSNSIVNLSHTYLNQRSLFKKMMNEFYNADLKQVSFKRVVLEQKIFNENASLIIIHPMNLTYNWIARKFNETKTIVSNAFFSAKGPRAVKNRNAILRIFNVIQAKISNGYRGRTRNDCPFDRYGKRSCGPVDLCIDGQCLECAVVEQLVDVFVEGICNCINRSSNGIPTAGQLTGNETQDKRYAYNYDPWPYTEEEYHYQASRFLVDNSTANELQEIENELTNFILSIYDKIISWIFPSYSGTTSYTNSIGKFFTNTNASDTNSIFFWILFFSPAGCDIDTMVTGDRGYGLETGVKITILFYVIILILGAIFFAPLTSLGLILLPFAISVLMATSYLMSPGCLFPTPLPLLPYPLADDMFKLYVSWTYEDCISWNSFLPGITSPICPNATNDYTREFVNCAAPPYSFVDGFRNAFFYLQWYAPGFANLLQVTEVPLLSWVREISFLEQRLTFDFGPSGVPNNTWISCNYETIAQNSFVMGAVIIFPIVVIFFFGPAIIDAIEAGVDILIIVILAFVEVTVIFSGTIYDRDKYFKDERELPKQKKSNAFPISSPTKIPSGYSSDKKKN